MKNLLFTGCLLFLASLPVSAKAYFKTRAELVTDAVAIAVIELGEPEPSKREFSDGGDPFTSGKSGKWSYSQQTKAKVIRTIKGKLPEQFMMLGGEGFICAQCKLSKGRFLVFLDKDKDYWVGSNWHLSLRPIKEDTVEWYVTNEQRFPMSYQKLEAVIGEIGWILAESKPGKK